MIASLLFALSCVLDMQHCTRWVVTPWQAVRCAQVTIKPACELASGWHEFTLGVPVCTRECGAEGVTG